MWKKQNIKQDELYFEKKKIPFCGGWFVYLGYELAKEIEPTLHTPSSPFKLPTAFASIPVFIFDHIDNEIFVVSDDEERFNSDLSEIERDFSEIIDNKNSLSGEIKILEKGSDTEHQEIQLENVLIRFIQEEIFQANLSRLWKFEIDKSINEVEIYKQLRMKNPAPFAGLIKFEDSSIISSSPERLVSVDGSFLETRPIAGTRPRGSSALHDIELSKELINSDKEKAEHLMLR